MNAGWRKAMEPTTKSARALMVAGILGIATSIAAPTTQPDWQPQRAADSSLQLWTRPGPTPEAPYQEVRAEITVSSPIRPLLAQLQDATTQHHWLPYTHAVRVLDHPAEDQTRVQFLTQSRWPFKARDAITLFDIDSVQPNQILIRMINQPDSHPPEPGYLRIQTATGHWLLTALPQCQTRVQYQSGSRWGGLVPQWLVDSTNERLAGDALTALQRWSEQHYQDYLDKDTHAYDFLPESPLHRNCR